MSFLQVAMLMGATCLLMVTAGLLIIRTMPSRDGISWWIAAAAIQFIIYSLGAAFFGAEESVASTTVFYCLQMTSIQTVSIGMLLFIEEKIDFKFRMVALVFVAGVVALALSSGNQLVAVWMFSVYLAFVLISTALVIWRFKDSPGLLKLAAVFHFMMGLHWLDFPIMGKVEWFLPIGFLLGLGLALGMYLSLVTLALLQFKKITNDSERKAIRAANHDPLTDLYNRSYLNTLFQKYKGIADRGKGSFIMLYIDLDGFKEVNDTYGHKAGDVILIVVAKRLKRWLAKKGDAVRIGGDELVVINSLKSERNSKIIYGTSAAQSILKLLEQPIIDGDNVYNISASIGGCYYGPEFEELEVMLSRSDELMYSAKQAGKRRVHFGDIPGEDKEPVSEVVDSPKLTKELAAKSLGFM